MFKVVALGFLSICITSSAFAGQQTYKKEMLQYLIQESDNLANITVTLQNMKYVVQGDPKSVSWKKVCLRLGQTETNRSNINDLSLKISNLNHQKPAFIVKDGNFDLFTNLSASLGWIDEYAKELSKLCDQPDSTVPNYENTKSVFDDLEKIITEANDYLRKSFVAVDKLKE